jgi:predicted unusual protein kinase regulating ubiquinone biosynthesis (AarF/ABC1/UbiB family)
MAEIPESRLRRGIRLAGLPAAHAGRAALGLGKRIGGRPAELVAAEVQARTAAQLFEVLGELKGGAMKVGQALSAMEALFPAELAGPYRDALTRLQEAAPPLPASAVHDVLAGSLGSGWRDRFDRFDDGPAAAASIGQVHRATWHDGTEVAVKIQYPGVAEALTADLAHLDRAAPLVGVGAPKLDPRALFAQLRERLMEELDYHHEAEAQRAFATAFEGDPDFVVPAVVAVADRVLVTEWLGGTPLNDVIASATTPERDATGRRLLRLLLSSPERVGRIHGDPHPGNFRVLDDGRLVVLDFGSSEAMPNGWPPALGRFLAAGRDHAAVRLHDETVATGVLAPGDVTPQRLLETLSPWFEPLRTDRFHFERSWLQPQVRVWANPRSRAVRLQRKANIPTRYVLVQRVAFGLLGVLTSLDATVPVRSEAERWLPRLV